MSQPPRASLRPSAPRIIIADDDAAFRSDVRAGLQDARLVVIAEADNGRDAVDLALHFRPEVVLMDVVMIGLDGIDATRRIAERAPEVAVILLTSSEDEELGVLGLRAGADGHLVKGLPTDELVAAVRRAAAGEPVLAPAVARRLIERLRALPEGGLGVRPVRSPLTSREWEVLDLLCAGLTVDGVADRLVLSRATVRTHVKRILRKLGVRSQRDAIEMANSIRATYAPGHRAPQT
ncbi:MAG TPA: response regulator transcription factor [Solirubrobacteraceae bacterium]|nr:response regulator transcription factor [Solirubrobacteraceae bacterium]